MTTVFVDSVDFYTEGIVLTPEVRALNQKALLRLIKNVQAQYSDDFVHGAMFTLIGLLNRDPGAYFTLEMVDQAFQEFEKETGIDCKYDIHGAEGSIFAIPAIRKMLASAIDTTTYRAKIA